MVGVPFGFPSNHKARRATQHDLGLEAGLWDQGVLLTSVIQGNLPRYVVG